MKMEFFALERTYYMRQVRRKPAWRWERGAAHWQAERQEVPAAAVKVEFEALPGELREEILAFAARATAMGPQAWGDVN